MASRTTAGPSVPPASLIARARAAMPGFTAATAAIDSLDAHDRSLRPKSNDALDHIGPDVADELLEATGPVDWSAFELGTRATRITEEHERIVAEKAALARLRAELVTRRQDTTIDGADHALAVVRTELDTVLDDARPVLAALDGIRTAQSAIDADLIDEWRQALALAARYGSVRSTQRTLVAELKAHHLDEADETIGDRTRLRYETRVLIDMFGYVANAAELVAFTSEHRAGRTDDLPWLTDADQGLAALAYVCRDDVTPWLPSMGELGEARAAHDALVREQWAEAQGHTAKVNAARRAARANATGITVGPQPPVFEAMARRSQ